MTSAAIITLAQAREALLGVWLTTGMKATSFARSYSAGLRVPGWVRRAIPEVSAAQLLRWERIESGQVPPYDPRPKKTERFFHKLDVTLAGGVGRPVAMIEMDRASRMVRRAEVVGMFSSLGAIGAEGGGHELGHRVPHRRS